MAIAAMILGIVSLVFCWFAALWWLWLPAGVAGIILGALGKKNSSSKQGMATAGLVMSIIGLALGLICFVACIGCAACYGASDLVRYY